MYTCRLLSALCLALLIISLTGTTRSLPDRGPLSSNLGRSAHQDME